MHSRASAWRHSFAAIWPDGRQERSILAVASLGRFTLSTRCERLRRASHWSNAPMSDSDSGVVARYPDLAGRTVFVSGGASGIGAAIVRAFAAQRCNVAFIDIDDAPARALADGAALRYWHCDVRDVTALRDAIATRSPM